MRKKTIVAIAIIIVAIVGFILFLNKPVKNINENDIYNCTRDSDCVSFQAECCNCRNGGANIALNRKYLDYWVRELSLKCQEIVCTTVISDDWTCLAKSKCVDSKCQLAE